MLGAATPHLIIIIINRSRLFLDFKYFLLEILKGFNLERIELDLIVLDLILQPHLHLNHFHPPIYFLQLHPNIIKRI